MWSVLLFTAMGREGAGGRGASQGPGSRDGRACVREDGGKPPPGGSPSPSSAVGPGGVEIREASGAGLHVALGCHFSAPSPHTLDIDGRRYIAPSPTRGVPVGWTLFSNVSSASSEG